MKNKGDYFEGHWEEDLLPLKNGEIKVEYIKDKAFVACPYCKETVEVVEYPFHNYAEERKTGNVVGGERRLGELACGCKILPDALNSDIRTTMEIMKQNKKNVISFYNKTDDVEFKNAFEKIDEDDLKGYSDIVHLIDEAQMREIYSQVVFVRFEVNGAWVEYGYPKSKNADYVATNAYGGDKAGIEFLNSIDFSILIEKILAKELEMLELGEYQVKVNYISPDKLHAPTDDCGDLIM